MSLYLNFLGFLEGKIKVTCNTDTYFVNLIRYLLISGIHTKEKFDSDLNLLSLNEQWVEWDVSYLQVME